MTILKLTIASTLACLSASLAAVETGITYQGYIEDSGHPFTAVADMEFTLYDGLVEGNAIGSSVSLEDVPVMNGLFQVELDFGTDAFDGSKRFLQIEIDGQRMEPRQPINAVPQALYAAETAEESDSGSPFEVSGNTVEYWANSGGMALIPDGVDGQAARVVMGHSGNIAPYRGATISGGGAATAPNEASGNYSVVGGGLGNTASDFRAVVGGGTDNEASGEHATVGAGRDNHASGEFATVPGGISNRAAGHSSFAVGRLARAEHDSTFVWNDSSQATFGSTAPDQFLIRSSGGVGINTDSPARDLHIQQASSGPGEVGIQIERSGGSLSNWGVYIAESNNLAFSFNDNMVARLNWQDGEIVALSDQREKMALEPVDGVLESVLQLEPKSYYMQSDANHPQRLFGFIAQDIESRFPGAVSKDEDIYGVSYNQITALNTAAITELHDKLLTEWKTQHTVNNGLQSELAELKKENLRLRQKVADLSKAQRQVSELHDRVALLETMLLEYRQHAQASQ